MQLEIIVESEIRSTEDESKVLKAITNFFDAEKIEVLDSGGSKVVVATSSNVLSLSKLHRALRVERILDAARNAMKRGIKGSIIVFHLHKQAAYVGRLSFVDGDHESPLGSIRITIRCNDPQSIIDWLAPPTSKGKPLWEREAPI